MRQPTLLTVNTQPLDAIDTSKCYKGQIVYNPNTQKRYVYGGDPFSWIEIFGIASSKEDKHEGVLECKSCGARLQSAQCEYCGTWSWDAKEFFMDRR